MTTEELVRKLSGWKEGAAYRAPCPVHQQGRRWGRSLAIYPHDDDRSKLVCYGGCKSDDILAAVGLTWKDTLYNPHSLSPEEKREYARRRRIDKMYEYERRKMDMNMMLHALSIPPHRRLVRTQTRFERDIESFCSRVLASL